MKENIKCRGKGVSARNYIVSESFINDITRKGTETGRNDKEMNNDEHRNHRSLDYERMERKLKNADSKRKIKCNSDLNSSEDDNDPEAFFNDVRNDNYHRHEVYRKFNQGHSKPQHYNMSLHKTHYNKQFNQTHSNKGSRSSSQQLTINHSYQYQHQHQPHNQHQNQSNSSLHNQLLKNTTSSMTVKGEELTRKYQQFAMSKKSYKSKRVFALYDQGMENIKRREYNHSEKNRTIEEEYKGYPYKPVINRSHSMVITRSNDIDFYTKNQKWRINIEKNNQKKINDKFIEESAGNTFKPSINPNILPDDTKFINRNIRQMITYVKRRQMQLSQQEPNAIQHNRLLPSNITPIPSKKIKASVNAS